MKTTLLTQEQRCKKKGQMQVRNTICGPLDGARFLSMFPIKSACSLQVRYSVLITKMNGVGLWEKQKCIKIIILLKIHKVRNGRDSLIHLLMFSAMPSLIGSLNNEHPVSIWIPSVMDIPLPHEATHFILEWLAILSSILSLFWKQYQIPGGTATSSFHVDTPQYAASWPVCPHIHALPFACPSLYCRGEGADLSPRPIVPGSHVSRVLVGLTNGRYYQENRGWGKEKTVLQLHFFHGSAPAPPGQIHHGFNLHWNTFSHYPSNLAIAVASLLVTSELLHCSQGDFWTSFVTCV